ncbi:nurim-like [Clavelina lepadiformis]|uniref:nurim-like n=1 Tax=Clavelina lepadiformis TaxID=159417 RepID=UPI0040420286
MAKTLLKSIVFTVISVLSILYTFSTMFKFILFVSGNSSGLLDVAQVQHKVSASFIAKDLSLISIFIAVHSVMATVSARRVFTYLGLNPIHRSVYNSISCFSLELLMKYWVLILPDIPLIWDKSDSSILVYVCQVFQALAWLCIFAVLYILDFAEFIGAKQVQYYVEDLGCPLLSKTAEAQSVFKNMRHPVVSSFLIVLWCVPSMTIDRFILASILTLYPLHMSNISDKDYAYVRDMYARKNYSMHRTP